MTPALGSLAVLGAGALLYVVLCAVIVLVSRRTPPPHRDHFDLASGARVSPHPPGRAGSGEGSAPTEEQPWAPNRRGG